MMTSIYKIFCVCAVAVFVFFLFFTCPARDAHGEILGGTITFTSGAGFTGTPDTAADGQGGSTGIADITIEVYGISDSDGTKLTADGALEFHSDWVDVPPIVTWNGSGATYGMAIKSAGGTNFKLTSVNFNDWGEWEGDEWTIEAFDNDISQGTRTFNGSTDGTNVPLAQGGVLDAQFDNIDEVRIYKTDGTGSWFGINDIVIDNPVVPNTAPTFVGATTTLTVSQNSGTTDIKGLLHVSDADASQTETWSQSVAPSHGTLGFSGATASSGTTDITSGGTITYQPAAGYIGTDTFTVQVSDGTATATRQITVTVIPPLTVTSIVRKTPTEAVTNADSLVFRVTFSTPVNNLSTGDFAVSGTTAMVTGVTSADYMVCDATISGGNLASLNGTVTLGFAAGQNITDTAGNAFTNTTPTGTNDNTYTVDNTVSAPSTPDLAAASDSGSSSTDNVTSDTMPTITGTAEADATVTLYDTDGTTALGTATATGGDWSITGSSLGAGAHTLTAKAIDTAGNVSSASVGLSITIDTTGPAITFSSLAFSADTGTSSTDFITSTAAQTVSATLSGAPAGSDIVYGSLDNGSTWTDITAKVSGTTLTWNGVTLAGSNTLKLKVTDNAGNDGTVASQAYTLDTTGPATTVATAAFSADTGASSTDFVTNTAAQTVSGTLSANLAAGEIVEVSLDNGSTWTAASATVGQNTWSLAGQTLAAGNTLKVRVADTAGNSETAYSQAYLLDLAAPTVTSVAVPANATYAAGQNLDFTVNVDSNVTVAGTDSTLSLTIGAVSRWAAYQAKTATSITYRYTVQSGDIDNNGITVGALTLNTTTIQDSAGNNATVTLNSVGSTTGVLVDSLIPTATAATSVAATGFSANWGAVTGATGYYLDVATDSGFTSLVTGYNSKDVSNVTTSAVSSLSSGATYYYRVRAYNGSGTSGNSNGITVSTLPAAPTATTAGSVTFTGFSANWNSVASATGYYLDLATDSGFTSLVTGYNNLDAGNVTSLGVTGLTAGTPYYYRVRAYNSNGTSASSNTIALTTATTRVVTTVSDSGAGSLRQVVADANPGDVVTFDSSLDGQIIAIATDLSIDQDLTVTGPGASNLIISGGDMTRIFTVNSGRTVHISGLTLSHGKSFDGPAIFNSGVLTVANATISGNYAQSSSGSGIYNNPGATLTVTGCTISGNTADALGGGVYNNNGTAAITNTTISGNAAMAGGGGGIVNNSAGTLTVDNSTIAGNSGGGLVNLSGGTATIRNAIFWGSGSYISGVVTISDSIVTNGCYPGSTCTNVSSVDPLLGVLGNYGGPTGTIPLLANSPAIDTGSCASGPATDQRGMTRPQDATCDMGAYERGVPAALTATAGTLQSTAINTTFATSLAARVVDSLGSVLDGIDVTFTGPGSGAGIGAAGSAVTNSSGIATYGVTANGTAGSYTVTAAVSALNAGYSLTNDKGTATVSLGNLTTTYDGTARAATATTTPAGLAVAITYDGSASAPTNVGSYAVVATVNDSNYNGTASGTLTIDKAGQAIAFGTAPAVAVGGTGTVSATGGASSSPVVFSSTTTSVCTISGTTVTGITVGTCTIAANQAADTNYSAAAHVTQNIDIGKAGQAIAFGTAPTVIVGGIGTVSATGGASTSPVVFSSTTTSVCTISGTTVTGVTAGTCTIAANQAADANYDAAPQVTQDITVGKGSQSIAFAPLPPKYFGIAPFTVSATATSGLPVAFASSNSAVATVSGSTVTIVGVGETAITASQPGSANFDAAVSVSQNLTITLSTAPPLLTVSALPDGATTTRTTQNTSGTVTDINGINSLTVNGTSVAVNPDGSFSSPVQLVVGGNSITVTATNNVGAVASDIRTITLDSTVPYLTVTSPPDNAAVAQNYVAVTGTISELSTNGTAATIPGMIVTYTVNGSSPQVAALTDATFSFTANLTQGMNTILVSAANSEGKTARAKRTLSSLSPFSLAITTPESDIRTVRDSFLLTGTVADNATPVAITVDMDGQSYHPVVVDGAFQQQLSLSDAGVYRVSVTGIDENSASQTVQRNIIRTSGASNPFTIVDALQALMKTVGVVTLPADQVLRLDVAPMVNGISVGDGVVDIEDTIVILRMAVGLL